MKHIDINGKEIANGDVIDIHQTVNGQNLFVVLNTNPLDIRYGHDLNYKYQYNQNDLLKSDVYTGEPEFEIINNIYKFILLGH